MVDTARAVEVAVREGSHWDAVGSDELTYLASALKAGVEEEQELDDLIELATDLLLPVYGDEEQAGTAARKLVDRCRLDQLRHTSSAHDARPSSLLNPRSLGDALDGDVLSTSNSTQEITNNNESGSNSGEENYCADKNGDADGRVLSKKQRRLRSQHKHNKVTQQGDKGCTDNSVNDNNDNERAVAEKATTDKWYARARFDDAIVPEPPKPGELSTNPYNRGGGHGVCIMRTHDDGSGIVTTGAADRSDPYARKRNVHITNLNLSVAGHDLLENAELRLNRGERYGLFGLNGSGKTTLLQRMSLGAVGGWPPRLRASLVSQECAGGEDTAIATVLAADIERLQLLEEESRLLSSQELSPSDAERLAVVQTELDTVGAATAESRAEEVLRGLGFDGGRARLLHVPTRELSGGWRMRVALASALFSRPDVLLLDEPTNHLDLEGVLWLQDYLCENCDEVMLIVVSHDRAFLDTVATQIIHLHLRRLVYYPGNYSTFEQVRADRGKFFLHQQSNLDKHRKHIQESADRMRKMASKSKKDEKRGSQVASRKKKLERMGLEKTVDGKKFNCQLHSRRLDSANDNAGGYSDSGERQAGSIVEPTDPRVKFTFPKSLEDRIVSVAGDDPVVQLRSATIAYGKGTPVLKDVEAQITLKSRIAVVGLNGMGKSTLLHALFTSSKRDETPTEHADVGAVVTTSDRSDVDDVDAITVHSKLRVAYFTQHHMDGMNLDSTPLEHMRTSFPAADDQMLRAQLGSFGIDGRTLCNRPLRLLSGGQKSRVVFAAITHARPHILLLDEPTNHLDLDSIAALVHGLKTFDGGVVLVSHNRFLITELCKEVWVVARGQVTQFKGTFDDYCQSIVER